MNQGTDITRYFSERLKTALNNAFKISQTVESPYLDTDHMLYALLDDEVVQKILKE